MCTHLGSHPCKVSSQSSQRTRAKWHLSWLQIQETWRANCRFYQLKENKESVFSDKNNNSHKVHASRTRKLQIVRNFPFLPSRASSQQLVKKARDVKKICPKGNHAGVFRPSTELSARLRLEDTTLDPRTTNKRNLQTSVWMLEDKARLCSCYDSHVVKSNHIWGLKWSLQQ